MHNTKAVLFDFNGVIIDDFLIQKEAWSIVSQKIRGLGVTDSEMYEKIRGVPSKDTVKRMSEGKLNENEIAEIAKEKDVITERLFKESPLFRLANGLETFLDDMKKKNIPRNIATSSRSRIFRFAYEKLGLVRWFEFEKIVYSDDNIKGKPAPDPYIIAAKKIGVNPEECMVFEDAINGIQSARSAGVKNIVAVGKDMQLKVLCRESNVIKGIRDFTEVNVDELFGY